MGVTPKGVLDLHCTTELQDKEEMRVSPVLFHTTSK